MIEVEMTSLEIAELTGKKHFHILRDIRDKLIPELDESKNGFIFSVVETTYYDSYKRNKECFKLNKYAANALVANYKMKHAILVVEHIHKLEMENFKLEEDNRIMKDIVWKVIKDKSYLGRVYALQSAGVKHPRLFLRYLRENGKFHTDVHERGLLKHQHVSPNTLVEMFTRKGFEWLLANKGNLDTWVEKQKVLEKQRKVLPC
ncbi:Rha-like protein [Shewanella sp. phage 1/40]|uniref:anti-repressor Ant n=1 Tax=Shewanella sp. phage 1/40 TaxID=1458860 RepID=UPI0004F8E0AB|nr:anti-repressor Ant [Shewanella sp. phage 1/40]AHK11533.1 Rha-like protein [Shewanella sp. phage 1/40]